MQARPRLLVLEPRTLLAQSFSVAEVVPLGDSAHPFDRLEVQFNEPVRDASFTLDQIQLTGESETIAPWVGLN